MNSRRELIVRNIVDTLQGQILVRLGTITRNPGIELQDIAQTAFPAVIVESGGELRESITQMSPVQQRQAIMSVNITAWINSGAQADSLRNDLIQGIESALEVDPTRGGISLDTQLTEVETGTDTDPYSSMTMIFTIPYVYTKGTP
jgi:hypothetical protein